MAILARINLGENKKTKSRKTKNLSKFFLLLIFTYKFSFNFYGAKLKSINPVALTG